MISLNNEARVTLNEHLSSTTQEDMFCSMLALRIKNVQESLRTILQLQIMTLLMNAETPHLARRPIPELPQLPLMNPHVTEPGAQAQAPVHHSHQSYGDNYDTGRLVSESLHMSNLHNY